VLLVAHATLSVRLAACSLTPQRYAVTVYINTTLTQGVEILLSRSAECFDDFVVLTRDKLDAARALDEQAKDHNDTVDSRAAQYARTHNGLREHRLAVHHVASLISTATGDGYYALRPALDTH
jgi:hypothetical protein